MVGSTVSAVGNQQPTRLLLNISGPNMNYSGLGQRARRRGVVVQHAISILRERLSQSGERPAGKVLCPPTSLSSQGREVHQPPPPPGSN